MSVTEDISTLRDIGWTWTRIGAHYRVSEREIMRWSLPFPGVPARAKGLSPPAVVNYVPVLVVNDTQYPHHDMALWEATCQIAKDAEIEEIVWAGDMLDFEQLSSFKFDPHKTGKAKEDVVGFHATLRLPLLKALSLYTRPKEHWIDGNHEHRYTRFMENHAALDDPDPVSFMDLEYMHSYYPYGQRVGHYLTKELAVVHGWATGKSTAVKSHVQEMGCSVIHGHTHRVSDYRTTVGDRVLAGFEVGHMSDYRKVPGQHDKGKPDWQQVAGTLVHKARKGESFNVDVLEVIGHDKVWANDRVYEIER